MPPDAQSIRLRAESLLKQAGSKITMRRFTVDFNELTQDGSGVYIRHEGLPFQLGSGEHVILYEPKDFEIEGVIEFETDTLGNTWCIGRFVEGTSRDLP